MAKAAKPIEMQSKHLTKKEIAERKEQEDKLKGNNDLVYKPPTYLSREEKKIYKFLVEQLRETGILNNLDITILETTVDAIYNMQKAKKIIDEVGLVTQKENGELVRNPATLIYKDYNGIFNKCCMELGLSPSARAKIASINVQANADKEDPLLKALTKRGDK